MPFTELITPSLKQDIANREEFLALWPELRSTITNAEGVVHLFEGFMALENNADVKSDFKMVLGLEWLDKPYFDDFVASQELKAFVAQLAPFITGPPKVQIYSTNVGPTSAFSAPITEVFRVAISSDAEAYRAADAWTVLLGAFASRKIALTELSGRSLNLTEEKFIGIIGWGGIEIRETAITDLDVAEALNRLKSFHGAEFFIVELMPHSRRSSH